MKFTFLFVFLFLWDILSIGNDDDKLLEDFLKSKGYTQTIVFDESNIKQFWVSSSVFSQDKAINILLNDNKNSEYESIPLNIQLKNVNERQDCKVEIISESSDVNFTVSDNKSKVLASSSAEEDFVQNHIASSTFHLEDTPDYSFKLVFSSKINNVISIKKVILSFSNNKNPSFLSSPGILKINRDDVTISRAAFCNDDYFEIKGRRTQVFSKNHIIVSDKEIITSVKIKNNGSQSTSIYVGYVPYSNINRTIIGTNNYPYKNINNILTVVSSEAGSEKIIVNSYPEWEKNCYLALDAKEDLNDVPNINLADGKIVEVKKLDEGKAELTLDRPFTTPLPLGTKVRIHNKSGSYLYMNTKTLKPGEEEVFTSSIKRDDNFLQYSNKTLSRGIYSLNPVILSFSADSEDNTIVISDYTISY